MSKQFYMVYFVDNQRARTYASLDEVEQAMEGRPSFYRQFSNEEEARAWLNSLDNCNYEMDAESLAECWNWLTGFDSDFDSVDLFIDWVTPRWDWNIDADKLERQRQYYEQKAAGINFLYIVCLKDKGKGWFASYRLSDIYSRTLGRVASVYPFPVNDPVLKELGVHITDSTVWDICKSTGEDPWVYLDSPMFDKSLCSWTGFEVGNNPDGTSWLKTFSEWPDEKRA